MAQNQEIKFIAQTPEVPKEVFQFVRFEDERRFLQEDVYAISDSNFFKLRINEGVPARLLRYNRLTSPVLRESSYEAYDLDDASSRETASFIFQSIPSAGVVKKARRQFFAPDLLLNVDTIFEDEWQNALYHVVEIECFKDASSIERMDGLARLILNCFGVKPYELLPYSNIHMVNMIRHSRLFRAELMHANKPGKLILVDGGSATGKSTIKKLLIENFKLGYAPRDTTREPRPDDYVTHDYNFISRAEFNRNALLGKYIEFRDFLFNMSYGLPWSEFVGSLAGGKDMMALINLGNGYFTKKLFPEATLVLLYADLEIIRARLEARGTMTKEQIDERIENNRLARTYLDAYDRAIDTSAFSPEEVAEQILAS